MQEANPSALSRAGGDGDHSHRGNANSSLQECPLTAPTSSHLSSHSGAPAQPDRQSCATYRR
eukprot:scaffold5100_cov61-Phaeocystis_antarctica.AAC.3